MMMEDERRPEAEPPPEEPDFNYRPLLEALRESRARILEMIAATGPRSQLHIEAEVLLDHMDTVARLTRVPAAVRFVRRRKEPKS